MEKLTIDRNRGAAWQTDLTPTHQLYDYHYWEKYNLYKNTTMELRLNQARTQLVKKYTNTIIDIGIGNGSFIEACQIEKIIANGHDINPFAIRWLIDRNQLVDPYHCPIESASLWDCLEHFVDPTTILKQVNRYCFVSIPIVHSWETIKQWKHYRPNEHLHYWDETGLYKFFAQQGFACCEVSDIETKIGRQDILTFVFKRVN